LPPPAWSTSLELIFGHEEGGDKRQSQNCHSQVSGGGGNENKKKFFFIFVNDLGDAGKISVIFYFLFNYL
jgi:hypothetical protein